MKTILLILSRKRGDCYKNNIITESYSEKLKITDMLSQYTQNMTTQPKTTLIQAPHIIIRGREHSRFLGAGICSMHDCSMHGCYKNTGLPGSREYT